MKKTLCTCFLLFFLLCLQGPKHSLLGYSQISKNQKTFIVAFFQSYRNFKNEFQQFKVPDSSSLSKNNYYAESRLISGIEIIYDKFSFGVGLRSQPADQSEGKGSTRTFNTNLNFGGNRWYFQNTFRYFKGFYDNNTAAYDTSIRQTGEYYKRPDLENVLFRSKFLYFTNYDKYAFRAGYAGNYRQLHSAGTWILSTNINYYRLRSDSSLFSQKSRPYYGSYSNLQGLRVLGLSFNVGAAATLVILKGFFISGMFMLGPEQQWRKYSYSDRVSPLSYISISGDLRFSIGINLKKCYFMVSNLNDFSVYNSSFIGLTSSSISGGFTFGWRFHTDVPEFYQKFQKTKFYSSI